MQPGEAITVPHYIFNDSLDQVRVTVTITSTGSLQFGAYAGTNEAPTVPLEPIRNPITLSADGESMFVWVGDWVAPPGSATTTPTLTPTVAPTITRTPPVPAPSPTSSQTVRLWLPWTHKDAPGGRPGP